MTNKTTPGDKGLIALTAAIIAAMKPGDELSDPDRHHKGLRVRCNPSGKQVFFYRYRASDGALRQIKLGISAS
jgi:hypothetical protein